MIKRSLIIISILLLFVWSIWYILQPLPRVSIEINSDMVPDYYSITNRDIWYPVQTRNSCGPYALSFALKQVWQTWDASDAVFISRNISWRRDDHSSTYPPWIEQYIRKSNVEGRVLKTTTDVSKNISLLEKIISTTHSPIILLWQYHGYQHYEVLLWYDRNSDAYYLYNPIVKHDMNGSLPWNETLSKEQLITFRKWWWEYGLYKRYAIVVWREKDIEGI